MACTSCDGHMSTASWLVDRCGMARTTAKDKLRVAHQLRRRPVLREAHAAGRLSYSTLRTLTRITECDDEADEKLLAAAEEKTVAELEALVKYHQMLLDHEKKPKDIWDRRGIKPRRRFDGLGEIEIVWGVEDTERLMNVLDAYREFLRTGASEKKSATRVATSVDNSEGSDEPQHEPATRAQLRADALVDLLEETVARLHAETTIDTTKAEVAVILDLGTKTRQWNAAQRRAIRYRFGGRCFVPGCDRRIVELHHTNPVGEGGATDLDLALPACKGHHHLVHEGGWTASYDRITGVATLTGPDGQNISCPPYRQSPVISPRRNPSRVEDVGRELVFELPQNPHGTLTGVAHI